MSGGHPDGRIEQNGTIYIGTKAVDGLASGLGITPNQAAQAIGLHEMGHAYYQQRIFESQPGNNATIDAKVDWCMQREGLATFYAYKVALESGSGIVAGTSAVPNLFNTMTNALAGLDPRSSLFEIKGIEFATQKFKEDPKYVAFCKNTNNWQKPSYLGPYTPEEGGSFSGSFSIDGAFYKYAPPPPIPGGYWIEFNTSNSVTPVDSPLDSKNIEIVGTSTHQFDTTIF